MSTLLDLGRRGEALTDYDVVDIHGHLGGPPYGSGDTSVKGLLRVMDRVGIRTFVGSYTGCLQAGSTWGNDRVLQAAESYPGRILAYARLWPSSAEDVRAEAGRCLERAGCVGVKLHNANGFDYAESAYLPALDMANERHMIALFHTWGAPGEFQDLRAIAARCPNLSILLGHAGCLNKEAYVAIAREVENVYLELCFSRAPYGIVEDLVSEVGAEKVLWGSDAVFLSQTQQIGKVLGARLPDDDKVKILSGNARRLLGKVEK